MIYMDNHATTRVDPRVLAAMMPWLEDSYGNAGSITHALGRQAQEAVAFARATIASSLGADEDEIVFTSGATESNNLALTGLLARELELQRKRHVVSVVTEHRAVLDPLRRLVKRGAEVTWLKVRPQGDPHAGCIDLVQLTEALREDTCVVSVMLANNEIGVIQPIQPIAELCQSRGVLLHTDATQAVGKIPLDLRTLPVDLLSLSAHKIYGPKGVGALFVRRRQPRIRLTPLLEGGGQEWGLRSGTLNVPGIVGLATALTYAVREIPQEAVRLAQLRNSLWDTLQQRLKDRVWLNGPAVHDPQLRLPGNLNVGFRGVLGETLMLHMPELAVSSGSACTAADPEPSHVLLALGLDELQAKSSLRFGLGRFNTESEIAQVCDLVERAIAKVAE